jgi:hypothetical protein
MIIWKCVPPNDLEHHTRQGWHLEQILVAGKVTTVQHSAPAQVVNNNPNAGYYSSNGSTVPVDSPMIVQEPMFLLKKDSDVESREIELSVMHRGEQELHKQSLIELEKVKRERDTYKSEADLRTKQLGESAGVQQKLHEEKRKLEGDLAKVQKAIGDLKYFEIVGKQETDLQKAISNLKYPGEK